MRFRLLDWLLVGRTRLCRSLIRCLVLCGVLLGYYCLFCFLLSPRFACLRFRLLLLDWMLVDRTFLVVSFFGVGVLAARLLVVSFAAV